MTKTVKKTVKRKKNPGPSSAKMPAKEENYLLELSEKTTSEDVPVIVGKLLGNRGKNLIVEAGNVERVDTPFLEALASASKLWLSDGFLMEIVNVTEAFENSINLLGISLSELEVREQIK